MTLSACNVFDSRDDDDTLDDLVVFDDDVFDNDDAAVDCVDAAGIYIFPPIAVGKVNTPGMLSEYVTAVSFNGYI